MGMRYYPILLNLTDKQCLVVGAGAVGIRKIRGLLDNGARTVLALDRCYPADQTGHELQMLLNRPEVRFEEREFQLSDLDNAFLVVAATSNTAVNRTIAEACRERGLLCNVADAPELGNFIVPATVCRGDLTLSVSTCGQSPALARLVRSDLEETFGSEYADLLTILGRLRPMLLELGLPTKKNTEIFRSITTSNLLRDIETNDVDAAKRSLRERLPSALHSNLPELLDGVF